ACPPATRGGCSGTAASSGYQTWKGNLAGQTGTGNPDPAVTRRARREEVSHGGTAPRRYTAEGKRVYGEPRTPNPERRAPNPEPRTPSSELRAPNPERRTPNAELKRYRVTCKLKPIAYDLGLA